jgi:hypothetical protein
MDVGNIMGLEGDCTIASSGFASSSTAFSSNNINCSVYDSLINGKLRHFLHYIVEVENFHPSNEPAMLEMLQVGTLLSVSHAFCK